MVGSSIVATPTSLYELAARYARAADQRDCSGLLAVFHPDATLSVYPPDHAPAVARHFTGHNQIAGVTDFLTRYAKTFHVLGQSLYEISNENATGEVYCIAHHLRLSGSRARNYVMYIRYQDSYVPGPDGWRIQQRSAIVDWTETRVVSVAENTTHG